jgi:unsaturated rhamnogalacturonyl hydrolase
MSEEIVSDDLMGVAPFLLASIEMEKLAKARQAESLEML